MKRITVCAVLVAALAISSTSFAGVKWVRDLAENNNNYVELTCPDKSVPIGFGYVDTRHSDYADAVTVICRRGNREFPVWHRDFENTEREMLKLTCDKGWKLVGLYYEDGRFDHMDALTAICKKGKQEIRVYNNDFEHKKEGVTVLKDSSEKIIGVAFKDGSGDKVDGATLVTTTRRGRR